MPNGNYERKGRPLLLSEQMVAWMQVRRGNFTNDIAVVLKRSVVETRAILYGDRK